MTLHDFTLGTTVHNDGWLQLIVIKGKVQQDVIHIFYSNIHHIDYTQLSFETEVYRVRMLIDPDRVSMLLGITYPSANVIVFPNQGIDKAYISKIFERKDKTWFGKLPSVECCMLAMVLNIILVHNLLQTSHKIDMSDDMVHLVASLTVIMCQMMLQTPINDGMKIWSASHLDYGKCGVIFPRDAVTLPLGLPIDDATIKRMEGQR